MTAADMTPRDRREARVALAMLPVGATVLVVSVLAAVAGAALLAAATFVAVPHRGWSAAWAVAAVVVAIRNALAGIAMMSAFDWRPLPGALALSAAIVAAWPEWWLG